MFSRRFLIPDHTGKWLLGLFVVAAVASCAAEGPQTTWLPLPAGEISRVAFGSCAKQWEPQPIWDAVIASEPDVFLYLGDAIYGDWDGENVIDVTRESLEAEWAELGARPEFQRLQANVPVMATWDNHDYGKHDGGAEFARKADTRELFLDFFGEPAGTERRKHDGVYDAKIFGPPGRHLQIILLDTRYFKGPSKLDPRTREEKKAAGLSGSMGKYAPNNDPGVTLLGDAQWKWLEAQLQKPAEVRLICSSTQVIADQKGMDEWGNYPHERERLIEMARSANGVILLSGNIHVGELSRLGVDGHPLYDFTSSGLTHVEEAYGQAANPYRVGEPVMVLNFGLVEIDWESDPRIVRLSLMDVTGNRVFERDLQLEREKHE